jgi:DNA polymerase lambda
VGRTFANELYKRGARTVEDLRTNDYGLTTGQLVGPYRWSR